MAEKFRSQFVSRRIKSIRFQVMTPDEAMGMSSMKVESKDLYDASTSKPNPSGPLDLRMGTSSKNSTCTTCSESLVDCAGHFGYTNLCLPVYHIGFLKHTINILNCVCKSCGSLLLPFNVKMYYKERLSERTTIPLIINQCKKVKKCPSCMKPNSLVKKNTGFRVFYHTDKIYEINPLKCQNILKMIKKEDYIFLGMDQDPSSLLITKLPVLPACTRPSVDMQEKGSNEDDITVKISQIINANQILSTNMRKGGSMIQINEDWDYLQLQVALLINSDLPSINMQNTPIRGVVQRLKGKQGRFRCNLSGKRVDFSGRTVISPDPMLSVTEVGIPERIAKVLTIPEVVTELNYDRLHKMVKNGPDNWPGANFVQNEKFRQYLKYGIKNMRMGDIVERHLLNGDILLFNRQPSLHRMSIMAHKARIHKARTLRFNECVCAPYNADFDGDEMNIHLPQTFAARSEAEILMGVQNNICTARNGENLISATQDFITSAYVITSKEIFFDRSTFSQICMSFASHEISIEPAICSPIELFTGKQVIQVLIEDAIKFGNRRGVLNLVAKNRSYVSKDHPNEGYVMIKNNVYMCGRLDKNIIGGENKKNSLVCQLLYISSDAAVAALNSFARLAGKYLLNKGFSIGLSDVYPGLSLINSKNDIVSDGYKAVDNFIEKDEKEVEMEISSALNKIREECGTVCINELSQYNSPIIMQACGSKGSKINVSQMIACVGQQIISGKRIPNGFINRTLPHFSIESLRPMARGFVFNSFFSGLSSWELFFHAVSGREGLVDTAVKTAETGYMQRRLMKALEDLSVYNDKTVRTSHGELMQTLFGEDGMDPITFDVDIFIRNIYENLRNVETRCDFSFYDLLSKILDEKINNNEYTFDKIFSKIFLDYKKEQRTSISESMFGYSPYNNCLFGENNIEMKIRNIFNSRTEIYNIEFFRKLIDFVKEKNEFTDSSFVSSFMIELDTLIKNSIIQPGTAVGAIAGQSIGEPGTQMTLKTFHFAGVASMNITLGVPRLKEIINASLNISTPIITGKLNNPYNLEVAKIVKGRIERIKLKELCCKVVEGVSKDDIFIEYHISMEAIKELRLEIDIDMICKRINQSLKHYSVEKVGESLRIGVNRIKSNTPFVMEKLKAQILDTVVCGINTVTRVVINKEGDKYELLIEGTGFEKILGIPGIEPTGTTSNSIVEVFNILGIEAARKKIVDEIQYTMSKHGIKVDQRHVMLLADTMCSRGEVLGITRFGVGKMRCSTLMLASFEQTADYLFEAAVRNKIDEVSGVSESIICGIPIRLGTGYTELLWKK